MRQRSFSLYFSPEFKDASILFDLRNYARWLLSNTKARRFAVVINSASASQKYILEKPTASRHMNGSVSEKEQLEQRRQEIIDQLGKVNDELRVELDRDPEEQPIQIEQD